MLPGSTTTNRVRARSRRDLGRGEPTGMGQGHGGIEGVETTMHPRGGAKVSPAQAEKLGASLSINREVEPGSVFGGDDPAGGKASRWRAGSPAPVRLRAVGPARSAGDGREAGRPGRTMGLPGRHQRHGRRSGAGDRRNFPTIREGRPPLPVRGRELPGPTVWPGHTRAITTRRHASTASPSSTKEPPQPERHLMMGNKILPRQEKRRRAVRIGSGRNKKLTPWSDEEGVTSVRFIVLDQ